MHSISFKIKFHMTNPRLRESELSSSDGFDLLPINLPEIHPSISPIHTSEQIFQDTDPFSQWQLSRFNRTGTIDLCELFSPSIRFATRNLKFLTVFYFPFSIFLFLSLKYEISVLFVITDTVFNLISTSICFSLLAGESYSSRFHFLFSLQGLSAFLIQLLRSSLLLFTFSSLIHLKSTTTIKLIFMLLFRFLTLFHSCFTFEGRSLSVTSAFSFSFHLSIRAIPLVQSISIELIMEIFGPLGFFTFGFTKWIAIAIRSFVFLAICGSGSASITI